MALLTTPYGTRPNAGADLDAVYDTAPLQLGQIFHGSDGHDYRFVQAGAAAIAKNTEITVADTTFAAAASVGGPYKTPVNTDVGANQYFWARLTALTA